MDKRLLQEAKSLNGIVEKVSDIEIKTLIQKGREDVRIGVVSQEVMSKVPELVQKDTFGYYTERTTDVLFLMLANALKRIEVLEKALAEKKRGKTA